MRLKSFFKLLEDTKHSNDALSQLEDILAFLKIQGLDIVETESALEMLEDMGISIGLEELMKLSKNIKIIKDINQKFITLDKDIKDRLDVDKGNVDMDKLEKSVKKRVKKKLKKRFK